MEESKHGSAPTLPKAALAYAKRGVPVFPCEPGAKRPLTRNGYWDTTTDETRPIAKEAGMVRGLKLKLFAALLLRAMAQEQAEEGTEGVSPRHPSVARRLGLDPDSPELAIGERYLQEQGYIRPIALSEEGGLFVITEVGWKDLGYQHSTEGWRRRPWWRRMLGV